MNVRSSLNLVVGLAVFGFCCAGFGCGDKGGDDSSAPPPPPPAPEPAPTPAETAQMVPEDQIPPPVAEGISPRIKAEIDAREDGVKGSAMTVAGARATLQRATAWTVSGATAKSADDKAALSLASFGSEGYTAKIDEAATAIGLSGCEWGPQESVTVGKDKLAGQAFDGKCTRGGAEVTAAYVALPAEGLLAMGAFAPDGDSASVFGSLRSIAKAAVGDSTGVAACCAALRQNQASAPPHLQGAYIAAAGLCQSLISNPQGRQALGQVRALLAGAQVPAACR